ncbi:hypothetical protein BC629DRAFT_1732930, partial [Irpex lacteus]
MSMNIRTCTMTPLPCENTRRSRRPDKTEQRPSMPPPDQIMSDASPQMRRNPSTCPPAPAPY